MIDNPKRVYLPIPEGYYDLSDAEQEALCIEMADKVIAGLGAPERPPSEIPDQQES